MQQLSVVVEGLNRLWISAQPCQSPARTNPVLIALHGGTYTGEDLFRVAGGAAGSFVDIAIRNGFLVLRIDRPGYARSDLLPNSLRTPSPDKRSYSRRQSLRCSTIAAASRQFSWDNPSAESSRWKSLHDSPSGS